MRRCVPLLLSLLALCLPPAALAQSAGDEQYADPFGQVEEPSSSQDESAQSPTPEPAQTGDTSGAAQTQVVEQPSSPTLPATGLPVALLAGAGGLLLTSGTMLRRRVS